MKPCRREGFDHEASLGVQWAAAEIPAPNHFQATVVSQATSGLCHLDRSFSKLFLTMFSSFCAKFCSPRELKGGTFELRHKGALKSRVFA